MTSKPGGRPRLIINADDFGRDRSCTEAIAEGLANGAVTATSIMANGKEFERACSLAHRLGLTCSIGVHLVLDEGPPLSREMAPYLDADGSLCVRRSLFPLSHALARAVEAELTAQIEKVIGAGIRPTHLDSHRHIHTGFPIGRLVVRVARRYGIQYVRPARTLGVRRGGAAMAYKWAFNRYLASQVETADRFGDIADLCMIQGHARLPGITECMIHLDESARGLEARRLVRVDAFHQLADGYELIGHSMRHC
jgi:chitin disaccharide deacetylase